MAGSAGFSVSIIAVDKATARLDAINRRIQAMRAPAERFNKSLARFGDVSGINRLSESISTAGDRTLSFARSLEKAASPMAMLTSAATLAGVVQLSREWSRAGNTISNVAYALSMPVSRMSALQGGAKLAGSSVEAMTKSLEGANEVIKDAQFHRADAATPYWQMLHIQPVGPNGQPITPDQLLRQFAEATKNMTPHARMRAESAFGIDTNLDPMLRNGAKGFDRFVAQAKKTGGTFTDQMAADAKKLNTAWQRMGLDLEGVENRIVDGWSGMITKLLTKSSEWIEHNKKTADSIAKIGTEIAALAALKPVAWVLRLLGLGAAADAVAPAALAGVGAVASYKNGQNAASAQAAAEAQGYTQVAAVDDMGMPTAFENPKTHDVKSWMYFDPRYRGVVPGNKPGAKGPGGRPAAITVPKGPTQAAAVMEQTRKFWLSKGFKPDQVAGILAAGPAAESGFNPDLYGDGRTSYGLYQEHADRMAAMFREFGPHPTVEQQNEFAWQELNQPQNYNLLRALRASSGSGNTARLWTEGFERPADAGAEADRRAAAAPQFEAPNAAPANGHVQVDVHLHHAPPGTVATAQASGAARVTPPRVETSMAGVH